MNELSKSSLCRTTMGPLTVRTGFVLSSVGLQRFLFLRRKPRGPRAGATPPSVALRRLEAALSDAPQPGNASRRSYPCTARGGTLRRSWNWQHLAPKLPLPLPPLGGQRRHSPTQTFGNASRQSYLCLGDPMTAAGGTLRRRWNWHRLAPELPLPQSHRAARVGTLRRIPNMQCFVLELLLLWSPLAARSGTLRRSLIWQRLAPKPPLSRSLFDG